MSCLVKRNNSGTITEVSINNPKLANLEVVKKPAGNRLFNNPLQDATIISTDYMLEKGIPVVPVSKITKLNTKRSEAIAQEFEKLKSDINAPGVREVYTAMIDETLDQYEKIISRGYSIEINNQEPYNSSQEMIQDLKKNKRMKVMSTEAGFGDSVITNEQRESNPLLGKTNFVDANDKPLLANDIFRFVHDFFGHAKLGNGFGAVGEENAWNVHAMMYSEQARRAMTTETRGQNSWVNFSGVNDQAFKLRDKARKLRRQGKNEEAEKVIEQVYEIMQFADQKVGLLPEWVSQRDLTNKDIGPLLGKDKSELNAREEALTLGYKVGVGTSISDFKGEFQFAKKTSTTLDNIVSEEFKTSPLTGPVYNWAKDNGYSEIFMFGGRSGEGMAFHNFQTKKISINVNDKVGGIVLSDQNQLDRVMAHEIIHAIVADSIDNGSAQQQDFNSKLNQLIRDVNDFIEENPDEVTDEIVRVFDYVQNGAPEELITYGLTSENFSKFLLKVKSSQPVTGNSTSIWNDIIEFIKALISGDVVNNNVLEASVDILNSFIKTVSQPDANAQDKKLNPEETTLFNLRRVTIEEEVPSVQEPDTLNSQSFDTIASNPLINSTEEALEIYKNIYSDNFIKLFGDWRINTPFSKESVNDIGEPKIFFLTPNGFVTESYEEALKNTSDGNIRFGAIGTTDAFVATSEDQFNSFTNDLVTYNGKVKLNDKNKFIEIGSLSSNSDPTNTIGFTNYGIRQGKIDESRRKVNNSYLLQGKGALESSSILNSQLALWDGIVFLGKDNVKRNSNGTLILTEPDLINVTLSNSEGNNISVSKENIVSDLRNGKYRELSSRYPGIDETIYQIFRERNDLDSVRTLDQFNESPEFNEQEVQGQLLGFLNKMGVEVTSIADYVSRYNEVHGVDPTAEALADISNSIVAFSEGNATLDNLSEEVAHFAIEAFQDQNALQPALNNVHHTEEWAQDSQRYYDTYSARHEGIELDNIVRREILGKVLAKKLKDNFNTANSTAEAATVFDTLRNLWRTLLNRFREFLNSSLKDEVNEITDLIANEVLNNQAEQVFEKDLLKTSKFVMFSLSDKSALVAIKSAGQKLVAENKRLKATKTGNLDVDVRKVNEIIENNNEAINAYDQWLAVKHIISALNPQIRRMDKLIKRNQRDIDGGVNSKALYLNHEQQQAMRALSEDFKPVMTELSSLIQAGKINEVPQVNADSIVSEMREIVSKINELEGQSNIQQLRGIDNVVDRIIKEYNLPQETEARLRELIEQEFKDTSWFQSNYGSLEHSANPFLNILGKIINTNNNNAQTKWRSDYNEVARAIEEQGFDISKFRDIIEMDSEGNPTGFTLSPYDWGKFNSELKTTRLNALNTVLGLDLSMDNLLRMDKKNELPTVDDMTEEQAQKYRQSLEDWYADNTERRYLDEFYNKKASQYKTLGISPITQEFMKSISRERGSILAKYRDADGNVDFATIDESDLDVLEELALRRKSAKSEFDDNGDLKIDIELTISQDLKKLDESFKETRDNFKIKNSFFENLERIQTESGDQAAFEWLKANGGTAFNQNFWEGLQLNRKSIVEKLNDLLPEVQDQSAQDSIKLNTTIETLDDLLKKKTEILKKYQKPNNPAEIDYDNMSPAAKNSIKDIENQLQSVFRDANTILRKYDETEIVDPLVRTENTINESYNDALKDSGENELDFVLQHVTESDSLLVKNFKNKLDMIVGGQSVFLERSLKRFVANELGLESQDEIDNIDLTEALANANVEKMAIDFAKTRVFSYFKRFAPEGYDEFYSRLKRGDIDVVKFVNGTLEGDEGVTQYIDVNASFTWTEDEAGESFINPNYIEDFAGGIRQPKVSKFKNAEFSSKFAPDANGNATRSIPEFKMLQALWNVKNKGDEAYEITGVANQYQLPMISRSRIEQIYDLKKKDRFDTVKEVFNDTFRNRVDTLDYGEQTGNEDAIDQKNFRIIPRKYVRTLENVSDVSTELAYSYAKYLEGAYSYEQKVSSVSDALVLKQHLLNSKQEGGKSYANSNTIKMFDQFVDNQFYGFKQVKKVHITLPTGQRVDISRLALVMDRLIRNVNIAFNAPIAATGFVTGAVFRKIENAVGEHTQSGSAKFAEKEARLQTAKLVTEAGKIDRTTKLYRLLESSRILDIDNRLKSSGFNRGIRFFNNLGYEFHIMGDILIKSRVVLSVLDDFRLVNDRFTTFNNFKLMPENEGLSKEEMKEKWDSFRDESMYSFIENGENDIQFKQELIDRIGEEEVNTQWNRAIALAQRTSANIDGVVRQEDKSLASRHFLMQFTTAHRGWLTTAVQRKAKRNHFNFMTGQFEEGHYRSLGNYVQGTYGKMREEGFKELLNVLKSEYNELEPEQQRNVKRVMLEMGTYMFAVALGMLVVGLADDEDTKDIWALQFSSYVYFRTVSELGSVQAPTGLFGLIDIAESPFVGINTIKEIADTKGWSLDPVTSGAYEGHSKLYKKLMKITWGRHFYDLQNIKGKSDYFRLLNSETLLTLAR